MGIVLHVAINLVVSVRLLLLAQRTRALPELLLGLGYLFGGAIGWSLILAASAIRLEDIEAARGYGLIGLGATNIGVLAMLVFIWKVFRRNDTWAATLVVFAAVALVASFVYDVVVFDPAAIRPDTPLQWLGIIVRAATFAWSATEGLHYFVLLRRRARIGLGDPVVANRVLLWGMNGLAVFSLATVATLVTALAADPSAFQERMVPVYSVLSLVGGACVWLAFFPPMRYLRWIEKGTLE